MNWIKCSERLPEPSTTVLVWEFGNDDFNFAFYSKKDSCFKDLDNEWTNPNVTHWVEITPPTEMVDLYGGDIQENQSKGKDVIPMTKTKADILFEHLGTPHKGDE